MHRDRTVTYTIVYILCRTSKWAQSYHDTKLLSVDCCLSSDLWHIMFGRHVFGGLQIPCCRDSVCVKINYPGWFL